MLMNKKSSAIIDSIYRYPVKGLSAELLARVALAPGQTLPSDRRYAIENGPSGFDPNDPKHLSKRYFLMLMREERLAGYQTRYDDATGVLTISQNGTEKCRGNLEAADGRAAIETFFAENFATELKGPPKVLSAPGHHFCDISAKMVSIINLASVSDLESVIGQPVNPIRFRGNIYVTGWPAWSEHDLVGQTLAIGHVRLKVEHRIGRCAATNVDPDTAMRDMYIPQTLQRAYGHADCGIYANVITGGEIKPGDTIAVAQERLI
jgi:uncharacterized protein YcbX